MAETKVDRLRKAPEAKASIECKHENVTENLGMRCCVSCSRVIHAFDSEGSCEDDEKVLFEGGKLKRKKEQKSILKDLQKFNFPVDVKEKANQLFIEKVGDQTIRGNPRMAVIFACLEEAHELLGIRIDPKEIAKKLGIKKKNMSQGILLVSAVYSQKPESKIRGVEASRRPTELVESTKKEDIGQLQPMHLIPELLIRISEKVEIKDHLNSIRDEIEEVYDRVIKKSSVLNRSQPQSVAAGLIYYYLEKNKIKIPKKEFEEIAGMSHVTILKMSKEISEQDAKTKKAAESLLISGVSRTESEPEAE